jgi:signal transduction histidine kinase
VGPSNSIAKEAATGRLRTRRRRTLAGLVLIAAGLVVVLMVTNWLGALELVTVDARFAVRGTQAGRAKPVVIIAIDAKSLAALGQFPLRRHFYADAVDRVRRDGARLVVVDVELIDPSVPAEDNALIEGLRRAPGTILTTAYTGPHGSTDVLGGPDAQRYARVRVAGGLVRTYAGDTYRRFDVRDGGLTTLPVRAAQSLDPGFSPASLGRTPVWIDYAGGPGTFTSVSLVSVLEGRVPASVFRGKIAILGATDPTLGDVHSYSSLSSAQMSGAEIEANAMTTALQGAPLRGVAGWLAALMTVTFVVGLPPLVFGRRGWRGPAILGGAVIGYLALAQVLFDAGDIVPVAIPVLAALAVGLAALGANARLELRARAEEVIASRARLVQAADDARRRVERDLHDGVQQRLLALAMRLGAPGAAASEDLLRGSVEQVQMALAELRDLAHGAYPAILAEAGLPAALESLADHSQLPVRLRVGSGLDDVTDTIAQAVYFVAAESLANAMKHAVPSRVTIDAERTDKEVRLAVVDDGRGGADPGGSGLTGLADRAAAVGGTLRITSEPGAGTRIELKIPL